mgnify:CR=1 FL=1
MLSLILRKPYQTFINSVIKPSYAITTAKAIADKKKLLYQNKNQENVKQPSGEMMMASKTVEKREEDFM